MGLKISLKCFNLNKEKFKIVILIGNCWSNQHVSTTVYYWMKTKILQVEYNMGATLSADFTFLAGSKTWTYKKYFWITWWKIIQQKINAWWLLQDSNGEKSLIPIPWLK